MKTAFTAIEWATDFLYQSFPSGSVKKEKKKKKVLSQSRVAPAVSNIISVHY